MVASGCLAGHLLAVVKPGACLIWLLEVLAVAMACLIWQLLMLGSSCLIRQVLLTLPMGCLQLLGLYRP